MAESTSEKKMSVDLSGEIEDDSYEDQVSVNERLIFVQNFFDKKSSSTADQIRKAVVDLYLNVKIRSADEVSLLLINYTVQIKHLDEEQLSIERQKLRIVDSVVILDFVKQSVEILMEMRKSEFEEYQTAVDAKKRVQLSIDKQKVKSDGLADVKTLNQKLVSVRNSRFRQKLKQVADQMETPRTEDEEVEIVPEQYEKQL